MAAKDIERPKSVPPGATRRRTPSLHSSPLTELNLRAWTATGTRVPWEAFSSGAYSARSTDSSYAGEINSITTPHDHLNSSSTMHRSTLMQNSLMRQAWDDISLVTIENEDDLPNDDGRQTEEREIVHKIKQDQKRKENAEKFGKQVAEIGRLLNSLHGKGRSDNPSKPGKKGKIPRIEKHQSTEKLPIRKRIDKRIEQLTSNRDELEKLETSIVQYENQTKQRMKQERIQEGHEDKIKKNKNLNNYNERRRKARKAKHEVQKARSTAALDRKRDLEQEMMRRKELLAMKERLKQEKAKKMRQEAIYKAQRIEKQIRWGFLVGLCSRTNMMEQAMLQERERRRKLAQHFVIAAKLHAKLMPVVERRRVRRCIQAWDVFKKHWVMYRLWMSVKRKREAAQIIHSFVDDMHSAMKLPKRVMFYIHNVRKVQKLMKNHVMKRRTQTMMLCLQYTRVEEIIVTSAKKKYREWQETGEYNFTDIQRDPKVLLQVTSQDLSEFQLTLDENDYEFHLCTSPQILTKILPPVGSPLQLERAALDIKMNIVSQDVRERRAKFQQHSSTLNNMKDSLQFRFLLTEQEMAVLCLHGFVQLRMLEQETLERVASFLTTEEERNRYLIRYQQSYWEKLEKSNQAIASFFKNILFSTANQALPFKSRGILWPHQ